WGGEGGRWGGGGDRNPGGELRVLPPGADERGLARRPGAGLRLPRRPALRDPDRPQSDSRVREGAPAPDRGPIPVTVSRPGRVVVTGSVAFDYLMTFPGRFVEHLIPDRLSRLPVSFPGDEMRRVRPRGRGPTTF